MSSNIRMLAHEHRHVRDADTSTRRALLLACTAVRLPSIAERLFSSSPPSHSSSRTRIITKLEGMRFVQLRVRWLVHSTCCALKEIRTNTLPSYQLDSQPNVMNAIEFLEKYLDKIKTWKVKELKLTLSHTLVSIFRNIPHAGRVDLTGVRACSE